MYSSTLNFFIVIYARNVDLCRRVDAFDGDLYFEAGELVFSLNALHQFLCSHWLGFPDIDYSAFQKALYASRLNEDLTNNIGASVVIKESYGKVDKNLYCLRKLA